MIYVASDSADAIAEFAEFSPYSYKDTGLEFTGFEAIADWLVLRSSDVICASNSTFSGSAAFTSTGDKEFYRPDFGTRSISKFDPWSCDVITPESKFHTV